MSARERVERLKDEIAGLKAENDQLTDLISQWKSTVDILEADARRQATQLAARAGISTTPTSNYLWQKYFDPAGHPYYYNATTGESSWDKPADYGIKPKGPKGANLFVVRKSRRGELDNFYDPELRRAFEPFGNLLRAEMSVDGETGNSKGFGFVSYDKAESAQRALEALDGKEVGGKMMRVEKTSDEIPRGPKTGWGG